MAILSPYTFFLLKRVLEMQNEMRLGHIPSKWAMGFIVAGEVVPDKKANKEREGSGGYPEAIRRALSYKDKFERMKAGTREIMVKAITPKGLYKGWDHFEEVEGRTEYAFLAETISWYSPKLDARSRGLYLCAVQVRAWEIALGSEVFTSNEGVIRFSGFPSTSQVSLLRG